MTRYPEGPATSPGFLLWHLTLAWQRAVTAVLEPLDLTHVQFVLLACGWWLGRQGQVPNQLQLARQAGTDVKMTSQVVRRLEAKGLLERQVDPADTRARRLRLTAEGDRLAQRAITAVEHADAQFFGPEAAAITSLLQRMIGHDLPRDRATALQPRPAVAPSDAQPDTIASSDIHDYDVTLVTKPDSRLAPKKT